MEAIKWWNSLTYERRLRYCNDLFDHNFLHRLTPSQITLLYNTRLSHNAQLYELLKNCWTAAEKNVADSTCPDFEEYFKALTT